MASNDDIGELSIGVINTGEFGNNPSGDPDFASVLDDDGDITATFDGGEVPQDLLLEFDGFDIDSNIEVEVFLNGVSIGFLTTGVDGASVHYSFLIPAGSQLNTLDGPNIITFSQNQSDAFTWGVSNILIAPPPLSDQDIGALVVDGPAVTDEFGNKYNGHNDADGLITATFTGGTTDLLLNFDGYDIDTGTEVEVFLNGTLVANSLGKLATGVNDGISSYSLAISAAQQNDGVENTITFKQIDTITYKWGVTNIELVTDAGPPPVVADFTLAIDGATELGDWGNNPAIAGDFGIVSDADGVITASFDITGAPVDLALAFDAFDVDSNIEIEILVNGVHHSFLTQGANETLLAQNLTITAAELTGDATNTITFRQNEDVTFKWGVTNIQLDTAGPPPLSDQDIGALVVDGPAVTDEFGNKYNGHNDADGLITATFTGGTTDLLLNFDGYDIDTGTEVEVFLNGTLVANSLGKLATGVNDGISSYSLAISAAQQNDGVENTITFKQIDTITYKWGVTNIELVTDAGPPPVVADFTLAIDGATETGDWGNNPAIAGDFGIVSDADGVITASFDITGAPVDLALAFDAFDVDSNIEIEILVNGVHHSFLTQGANETLLAQNLTITAAELTGDATNTITFRQNEDVTFKWGVTNIQLDTAGPPPLSDQDIGALVVDGPAVTDEFGNKYNGHNDADGEITATFTGGTTDLLLNFDGYDIDTGAEVEVFLDNGVDPEVSLGKLATGVNDGISSYSLAIAAGLQTDAAINTITFRQIDTITYKWGVTNIELVTDAGPPPVVADFTLAIDGATETGDWGNNSVDDPGEFGIVSDEDGIITAKFVNAGAPQNLVLSFNGYDIDSNIEVEVFLNGKSQGFLGIGPNNGLKAYDGVLLASDQVTGDNFITFVQSEDVTFKWGVTDILIEVLPIDMTLALDTLETGDYGNNTVDDPGDFGIVSDADGIVSATFVNAGEPVDLALSFNGYDIDSNIEVQVFLNGKSQGFLTTGPDLGLKAYKAVLSASDQVAGENLITFVQSEDVTFKWGVTDVMIEVLAADVDIGPIVVGDPANAGQFGNMYGGNTDADGVVSATFTGTGDNLLLTFDAFDIDLTNELVLKVDGEFVGFITGGVDGGFAAGQYFRELSGAQVAVGEHTITFEQTTFDFAEQWGVTNIELDTIVV